MTADEFMGLIMLNIEEFGDLPGQTFMTLLQTYYPSLHRQLYGSLIDCSYAGSIENETFRACVRWLYQNWDK